MKLYGFILTMFFMQNLFAGDKQDTFERLNNLVITNPKAVINALDGLDKASGLPDYQSEYLRACSYYNQFLYYLSMIHARNVVDNKKDVQHTSVIRKSYMILTESASQAFCLEEAITYAAKGKDFAVASNDRTLQAHMILVEGDVYRKMGMTGKSYELLNEAAQLLKNAIKEDEILELSHIYGYLMQYYIKDSKINEAWQTGLLRERNLKQLKNRSEQQHIKDKQKGYLYAKMAYLAQKQNMPQDALKFYDLFKETRFSASMAGQMEINDYLLLTGQYKKVVMANNMFFDITNNTDSTSIISQRAMYQSGQAYAKMGDYRNAYRMMQHMRMADTQQRNELIRTNLFQLADIEHAVMQAHKLQMMSEKLTLRNYILVGLSILLLAMLPLLWMLRMLRNKNRKMVALMIEYNNRTKQKADLLCEKARGGGDF